MKRSTSLILFVGFVLALGSFSAAEAQTDGPIGGYTFTNVPPGAYADLVGDTPFVINGGGGSLDDGYSADQTIPFSFNFGGTVFTTYRVNTNGWMGFGSPTATTNYSALSGTVNNVIAFCNRDFNNVGAVYSSVTEGVAPNRIHKIQAKNFYRYNTPAMTGNAQVWLYETTNVIEFHYGAFNQTWTAGTTVQVGLRGASSGAADVRSLSGTGSTTWTDPVAGNSSTATMQLALTVTPDSGRVYTFTPVVAPNLGASTKTATPAFVRTGDTISYTVTLTNTGDATATAATISDPIPAGATYVAGSVATVGGPPDATYNGGTNAIEWGPSDLAPGASITVTFQVTATAASGATVTNTATLNASNLGAPVAKTTNTPVIGCSNDSGYACADSLMPGGPTYTWYDATGGTLILDALTGDDRVAAAVLPFPFTYYGATSSDILVGDNGAIVFGVTTGSIGFSNTAMATAPANFIAPFWDDLDTDTGGTYGQVFGSAPNRVYAVEWYNRPHYSNVGAASFEVLFFEGTNQIVFQYQDVDFGNPSYNDGASATVGIKGSTIQYLFNVAGLTPSLAIQFTPILPPNIDVSPLSLTSTQPADTTVDQPLTISNIGEADLTWTITESVSTEGLILPRVRSFDPGSERPDFVGEFEQEAKEGMTAFTRAGTFAAREVTPQRPENPDALVTITHSVAQTIVTGNSVSCNAGGLHTNNSYLREFDLAAFGISSSFDVTQVEFGVEQATSPGGAGQPVTVNLYTKINPVAPITWANLSLIGTAGITLPDQALTLYTVPVTGTAAAGSVLVVEVFTPNGQTAGNSFFIGSNSAGETAPSYIAAADCGLAEPATTGSIGFPNMHIVMNVTGDATVLLPCAAPSDVPWMYENPFTSTTAGGGSTPVTVTFDSTGLADGTYTADLCVDSNDPDAGPGNGTDLVVVPVTLTVISAAPSISLAKTVGTTAGVCSPDTTITVPAGTTVYYCYTVTNTGDVTLNLHDLTDDVLGPIFTGLNYALAPGTSVNTVAAGLSIPYVANATTTNTGTWTAYNAGPIDVATATASATVNVTAPAPAIALAKTVGTVPGVCAVTDNISVAAGTEVYYCYQVQNTGNVTFELHDLADDKLGAVLSNLAYTLTPGAFSPQVIVPKTINVTTTNTATWTAKTTTTFVDISATGTALNLTDDSEANIVSPFSFTFFGATSSDLRVGNNGGILFGVTTGDLGLSNIALPAATGLPAPAMLPFWDDMDDETGNVYWEVQGTAPDRTLIVEWYNRPHFSNTGAATYEVILYEGSNAIEFRYQDTDFGNAAYNFGISATSGLQQNTTTAVQYSFNQPVLYGGFGVRFEPPAYTPELLVYQATSTDNATVTALFPNIDVSPLSLTSTQVTNTVNNVPATIANTGAALLDWQVLETQPDRPANPGVQPAPEPVFNVPAAVTSKEDCGAFENYLGREPEGYAEFCGGAVEGPGGGVPEGPTDIGYLINLRTPDRNLKQFVLNNFPGQVVIGPQTANIYGMDFDSTATTLHALNSSTNQLGTLNIATAAFTSIVACPAPGGGTWTDLSIDPVTDVFYASTATNLYTLDPVTCSPALVGPFNIASGIMIDLAVNAAGQMYGHDIFTDSIYTIDTTTGAATLVGLTTYLANFAQGMDFDNQDGTLYIFLYQGSGANIYGTVNLTTGAVTPLATTNPTGEFEGATQTLGICVPTDYSWLAVNPVAGTTPPAGSTPLNAAFDSTGLAIGTYTGQLCVRSNDPDSGPGNGTGLVVVPVTLDVVPPQNPAISLAKTVGTTAGVCAATSSIVVAAGTTVYYCYEVTNTGDVTLNLHDLTDDVLGTIFTGLAYSLAPGASVNTVAAGLSIPYVVNSTTTNTGTWTAYNAGPVNLVTATASATVTVELVPDIEVAPSSLFSSQMTNTQVVQQLTIGNTGGGDLTWTLSEEGLPLHTASFMFPAGPAQAPEGSAVAAGPYIARPATSYTVQRGLPLFVPPNVMLLAADDDNTYGSPMEALLEAYGDLGVVDLFNAQTATPTLPQLQAYDVVVTWSNYTYGDPVGIGNVLADYVDAGGEVINLMFSMGTHGWQMAGRFMDQGYTAMNGTDLSFANICLGTFNPAHPIMAGVTDVCETYRMIGTYLTAGSSEIAQWADGLMFVAAKDDHSVVSINGYVGYNYLWTGQMPDVLHNAILWIAGAGTGCTNLSDVPWLSASPNAGTTPPAGSTPVDVTFDSTGIAVGTYNANLCAFSNDPDEPIVPVPVTMEVVIPVELMGISIE